MHTTGIMHVRVGVDDRTVTVRVDVQMSATGEPPEHPQPQRHQHRGHRELECQRQSIGILGAQQHDDCGPHQQRRRMAQPPHAADQPSSPQPKIARKQAGDRGQMIGVERMAHAEQDSCDQKAQRADGFHVKPS